MPLEALHALVMDTNEETAEAQLAMPAIGYGIVAICILMALLLITFAFRNLGARH